MKNTPPAVPPATHVVDDAVGVSAPRWYVAIVGNRSEKLTGERLTAMGIENYVPTQTEVRRWRNGRKSKVERVVISSRVFVHCSEQTRREIVGLPFIFRFMTNRAAASDSLSGALAVIPDEQIRRLRFMLGQSDIPVEVTDHCYQAGDRVRVIRGGLAGLEGEVVAVNATQSRLTVNLGLLGCARLLIDTVNLELISTP